MSELKSLEELREWRKRNTWCDGSIHLVSKAESETKEFDTTIEAIQREIDEHYMKLPVDADGVPIRPGNRIALDGKGGEVWLVGTRDVMTNDGLSYTASAVCHVKSRTVENVLREYGKEIADSASQPWDEIVARYAAELQMRGDVE